MCLSILRPYHAECTGSHLITEVKQHWAGLGTWMGDRLGIPSAVGLFYFPWNSSNVPFPLLSMATSMDTTSHCHPLSSLSVIFHLL